jgi:hypothetical protein
MEEHRSSAAPRHVHRDFRMIDDRRDRRHYENGIDAMQPRSSCRRILEIAEDGVNLLGWRDCRGIACHCPNRNPVVSQLLDHAAPYFSTAPRSSLDVAENSYASAQRFEANVR